MKLKIDKIIVPQILYGYREYNIKIMAANSERMSLSEIRTHINNQQAALDAVRSGQNFDQKPDLPPQMDKEAVKKSIICFVGLPGSGKSTQIERLRERLNSPVFHLAKINGVIHLESDGVPQPIEALAGKSDLSPAELDEVVLNQVINQPSHFVILDGFPRSPEQAERLIVTAQKQGWQLQAVYLVSDVRHAWRHQIHRARQRGKQPNLAEFNNKIDRSLRKDIPAIYALENMGVRVVHANAKADAARVEEEILAALPIEEQINALSDGKNE